MVYLVDLLVLAHRHKQQVMEVVVLLGVNLILQVMEVDRQLCLDAQLHLLVHMGWYMEHCCKGLVQGHQGRGISMEGEEVMDTMEVLVVKHTGDHLLVFCLQQGVLEAHHT